MKDVRALEIDDLIIWLDTTYPEHCARSLDKLMNEFWTRTGR